MNCALECSTTCCGDKADCACAGLNQLLQWPGATAETLRFAAVEGLSCQTGVLDGPAGLLTSLLACGPSSDAGLAALQAGQPIPSPLYMLHDEYALCLWLHKCPHDKALKSSTKSHIVTCWSMCSAR